MTILVTGAAGQLGSELAKHASTGDAVVALSRNQLDITDHDAIDRAMDMADITLVINAAAYTAVDRAESEPDRAMKINADGPAALASACTRRRIPFIHISTDYVFAGDKRDPYLESDPVEPVSIYGRSKAEGERRVLDSHRNSVIVRTAWVYSSHGSNFVRTMLRLAQARDRISVVDDQVGCPTSAADLAVALLSMARALQRSPTDDMFGVFHACGDGACTWKTFAEAIFEGSSARRGPRADVDAIPTSAYPTAAVRPKNSRLDASKLKDVYGIALPHWREGLSDCLDEIAATGWPTA